MRLQLTRTLSLLALSSAVVFGAEPGTVTGSFAAGERLSAPETQAPAHVSRMHVTTVTPLAGSATVEIPVTGGSGVLVWTLPVAPAGSDAKVASSLRAPGGRRLERGELGSSEEGIRRFAFADPELADQGLPRADEQEVLHVAKAEPGIYRLELNAPSEATAVVVVAAEPESALTLSTWAGPLSRQEGEPVTLHAELRDGAVPVLGPDVTVTARLAAPGEPAGTAVTLFDDGLHGDGAAGDGHFAASVKDLPEGKAGLWTVRFEAAGRDQRGVAFARTGASGFVSEPGIARLLPGSVRATWVGDGDARALRITGQAQVEMAGDYRFDVLAGSDAKAADGTRDGIAWGEATVRLPKGKAPLVLEIPAAQIGAAKTLHLDVRLLGLDPIGVVGRTELEIAE